jgi:hypothetical protein
MNKYNAREKEVKGQYGDILVDRVDQFIKPIPSLLRKLRKKIIDADQQQKITTMIEVIATNKFKTAVDFNNHTVFVFRDELFDLYKATKQIEVRELIIVIRKKLRVTAMYASGCLVNRKNPTMKHRFNAHKWVDNIDLFEGAH